MTQRSSRGINIGQIGKAVRRRGESKIAATARVRSWAKWKILNPRKRAVGTGSWFDYSVENLDYAIMVDVLNLTGLPAIRVHEFLNGKAWPASGRLVMSLTNEVSITVDLRSREGFRIK